MNVQRILKQVLSSGSVFYDVGANVGFYSLLAAHLVGESGHVHAFEPSKANVDGLRMNIELRGASNISVHEVAISDSSRSSPFYVNDQPFWSSLQITDRGKIREVTTVTVTSIDEIARRCDLRPPSVIKIDAEGEEFNVVRGMRDTLRSAHPYLIIEADRDLVEVQSALREVAYTVSPIRPSVMPRLRAGRHFYGVPEQNPNE